MNEGGGGGGWVGGGGLEHPLSGHDVAWMTGQPHRSAGGRGQRREKQRMRLSRHEALQRRSQAVGWLAGIF